MVPITMVLSSGDWSGFCVRDRHHIHKLTIRVELRYPGDRYETLNPIANNKNTNGEK
jgi:hypothetical protein